MIRYSIEQIYHFSCTRCMKWWTIGDFNIIESKSLICPHCGVLQDVVLNEEMK